MTGPVEDECGRLVAQVCRCGGHVARELFYAVDAECLDNYVFRAVLFLRLLCGDIARYQVAQGEEVA